MVLRIFDCDLCMIATLGLLAQLHSSIPYVQIGLITALQTNYLFSNDRLEFLPISQLISFAFKSVSVSWQCALFSSFCGRNVDLFSRFSTVLCSWRLREVVVEQHGSQIQLCRPRMLCPWLSAGQMCIVCRVQVHGFFHGVLLSGFGSCVRFRYCIQLRSGAPVGMISVSCNILWREFF